MKTYLEVPFSDKDHVRRLGAKWDVSRKKWFVENDENIEKFMRWMPTRLCVPVGSKPKKARFISNDRPPWD